MQSNLRFLNSQEINENMKLYVPVNNMVDVWILFAIENPSDIHKVVLTWRLEVWARLLCACLFNFVTTKFIAT